MGKTGILVCLTWLFIFSTAAPGSEVVAKKRHNANPGNATPSMPSTPPIVDPKLSPSPTAKTGRPRENDPTTAPGRINPAAAPCAAQSVEALGSADVAWSPQAVREGVCYFSERRELAQVFCQSDPAKENRQLTFFDFGVREFRPSPDGVHVLAAAVGPSGADDLYLFALADAKPRQIAHGVEGFAWINAHSFVYGRGDENSAHTYLVRRNVAAPADLPAPAKFAGWYRVADVSPDAKYVALVRFETPRTGEVVLYDVAQKKLQTVLSTINNPAGAVVGFSANGKNLWVLGGTAGKSRELELRAVENPGDTRQSASETRLIRAATLDASRRFLAAWVGPSGDYEVAAYDLAADGRKGKRVPADLRRDSFSPGLRASGGESAISPTIYFTRDARAPRVWEWVGGKETLWTPAAARAAAAAEVCVFAPVALSAGATPAGVEAFRPSGDYENLILYVRDSNPANLAPDRLPEYFLARGIAVAVIDSETPGPRRNAEDFARIARYAVEKRWAKAGHLFLVASGMNAPPALGALAQKANPFAGAAVISPPGDAESFLRAQPANRRPAYAAEVPAPPSTLGGSLRPLLVVAGEDGPADRRADVEKLAAAWKGAGGEAEVKWVADEIPGERIRLHSAQAALYFFEDVLKKKKGP